MQSEYVAEFSIVALGLEMTTGRAIDQLHGDANPATCLPDAPLKDVSDIQLAGSLNDFNGFAFEGEGGIPSDYENGRNLGEVGDNVLGDAVTEVLLFWIAAHVGEG